jgi:hypothetical protein
MNRVARFFFVQYIQTGEKYTKGPQNIPYGHRIFQMAIKYTKIFQTKALQNILKLGF